MFDLTLILFLFFFMTNISKSKSKTAYKYKADLWGWFFRKRGKVNRATRNLYELGRSKLGGYQQVRVPKVFKRYRLFDKITRILYRKRTGSTRYLTLVFRNSARLRKYMGGINKRHLKCLFKGYNSKVPTSQRIATAFEFLIVSFLFKMHFIRSYKEGRYFIKSGFFKVNNKQIFNWNHRINVNDVISFYNLFNVDTLIYIYWLIRFHIKKSAFLWGIPKYVYIDWTLFKIKTIRKVNYNELFFPYYGINLIKAVKYTRINL